MNNRTTSTKPSLWDGTLPWPLVGLLVLGLLVRLVFVTVQGFAVDVQTFIAWTISLVDHGLPKFYGKTSFVDYPPGYFYILALSAICGRRSARAIPATWRFASL